MIKLVISTDLGTTIQIAHDPHHAGIYLEQALREKSSSRVTVLALPEGFTTNEEKGTL